MATDEKVQEKLAKDMEEVMVEEVVLRPNEKFYTEGAEELKSARLAVWWWWWWWWLVVVGGFCGSGDA